MKTDRESTAMSAESVWPAGSDSLQSLAGTGRGLWGTDSRTTIARLRDEWRRLHAAELADGASAAGREKHRS